MEIYHLLNNNLIENARITALQGAEILLSPHQTGGCKSGSPFAMGPVDRRLWDQREQNPEALQAELRGDKGRGWLLRWLPARARGQRAVFGLQQRRGAR